MVKTLLWFQIINFGKCPCQEILDPDLPENYSFGNIRLDFKKLQAFAGGKGNTFSLPAVSGKTILNSLLSKNAFPMVTSENIEELKSTWSAFFDWIKRIKFSDLKTFCSYSLSAPSMDLRAASPDIQRFASRSFLTASRLLGKVLRLK